jgi:hypothetical protein
MITMTRRQEETPTSTSLLRDTVPPPLDAAVLKALARLPADRYSTAGQFGEAVSVSIATASGLHVSTSAPGIQPSPIDHGGTTSSGAVTPPGRLTFWEELKRRKVLNVAAVYIPAAWLVIEMLKALLEDFGRADLGRYPWYIAGAGFTVALILAWTFEVSRDGVQRTGSYDAVTQGDRRWPVVSKRALIVATAILAVVAAVLAYRWIAGSSG